MKKLFLEHHKFQELKEGIFKKIKIYKKIEIRMIKQVLKNLTINKNQGKIKIRELHKNRNN